MSKIGRYSADRKKVETLTTTGKEITVADCGTLFFLDGSSYSGDVTHQVPHPGDAKNGWWCKFVVKCTGSSGQAQSAVLDNGGDDCLIKVRNQGLSTFADNLIVLTTNNSLIPNANADEAVGVHDQDADFIKVLGEAIAGTQFEFITDGTRYYVTGQNVSGSGLSIDT